MDRADIVIVGGGLAAAAAAESYRKSGGKGSVMILSQEPDLPVHRPPLSKEYLRGDATRQDVFVHPAGFYQDAGIEVRLETRVDAVEPEASEVVLADGNRIGFGQLVLATGARPRRLPLPGGDLPNVFYLRSLASSEALSRAAERAERAVIIGAGFIGMEVAATLTQRGLQVTVVEAAPRMWSALAPPVVTDFIQWYYATKGVDLRFGAGVQSLAGEGRVSRVVLSDGEVLPADVVVIGVGAALNTQLAEAAGLETDRGVVVDRRLRSSHPNIYAIGDIAAFLDPIAGRIHVEHWDNALNQGRTVGRVLAGEDVFFEHIPYFFSDMFDLSLNMVGYPAGWDDIIVRGDPESGAFTTVYLKDGVVRAALMINDDAEMDTWTSMVRDRRPAGAIQEVPAHRSVNPEAATAG